MYYQDRLAGQGFARVLLGGINADSELGQSLQERLGTPVEAIDPTAAAPLSDRIAATIDVMDVLSPLTGVLLRTWAAVEVPA
jgi:hypothetical protein